MKILSVLILPFVIAGCSRSVNLSPLQISGVYTFYSADHAWIRKSGLDLETLAGASVILRADGSGQAKGVPTLNGKLASGAVHWTQLRPGVLDLEFLDRRIVMPVGIEDGTLSYTEDPEFPTNIVLKKEPD